MARASAFRPLPSIAEGEYDEEDGIVAEATSRQPSGVPSLERRTFLKAGAAASVVVLIGCAAVAFARSGRAVDRSFSSARLSDTLVAAADASSAGDRLVPLGKGFCHNHIGNKFDGLDSAGGKAWVEGSELSEDGVSKEGQKACLIEVTCTGVETLKPNKYALVTKATKEVGDKKMPPIMAFNLGLTSLVGKVYPAWVDKEEGGAACFWRQTFKRNSKELYPPVDAKPIPKFIWTFWQNKGDEEDLPPLVDFCMESWRQLNEKDGWEIRLLNEKAKFDWISKDDLPEDYEKHIIQHRADLVRLAVLNKHGGVWMDATTCLLKPLSEVLGSDPSARTFMTLKDYRTDDVREDRVSSKMFIENWFLAAPAKDPLFESVTKCVWDLQTLMLGNKKHWVQTHMFNDVQIEWLNSLAISETSAYIDNYLSTHACFMKEISEDEALWKWYHSPAVRRLDAQKVAFWFYDLLGWSGRASEELAERLFHTKKDTELYEKMTKPDFVEMMKLGGQLRRADMNHHKMTLRALWCEESTFAHIVQFYGLKAPLDCGSEGSEAATQ